MFGIRNLREPRELSQPNQLDMVGERGFEPPTPWSRTRFNHLLNLIAFCCFQVIEVESVVRRLLNAVELVCSCGYKIDYSQLSRSASSQPCQKLSSRGF